MRTSPDVPAPHPPAAPATVRLRSPGEIVSSIPYLLGFAPQDSLVVLGLRDRALALTCRLDLADCGLDVSRRSVVHALGNAGADRVLLVAFAPSRPPATGAMTSMARRLSRAGLLVRDRISVVEGRWFDEECSDHRCCPPEGVPVADHDWSPSAMGLQALTRGFRADRASVVAECHPDRPALQAALRSELLGRLAGPTGLDDDDVAGALVAVLGWGPSGPPSPGQLARAAGATAVPAVRDVCYAIVAPEVLMGARPALRPLHEALVRAGSLVGDLDAHGTVRGPDARDRLLRRVLSWVRNLPDDLPEVTMPALVVAATAHWCAGDGARARTLVERAHALDAEPLPMLATLAGCLARGVRPASPSTASRPRGRGPRGGRRGLSAV
jgi:hypothetical protein